MAHVISNVTRAIMPSSGKPAVDYIFLDGCPSHAEATSYQGINSVRSLKIANGVYDVVSMVQKQFDAAGFEQFIMCNGMDTIWEATRHAAAGAGGSMFDHWSILQFINRDNGDFNATMMDEAISMLESQLVTNRTIHVKGWPGPIVQQRDKYPPNIPTPSTPAELQQVAGVRFNSELALFLLTAQPGYFWVYSWFWGFDDYVPNESDSSVPADFFPQAKCHLGAPKGGPARVLGTWTYKREFEHASVFVDLKNRTASRVSFVGCHV